MMERERGGGVRVIAGGGDGRREAERGTGEEGIGMLVEKIFYCITEIP